MGLSRWGSAKDVILWDLQANEREEEGAEAVAVKAGPLAWQMRFCDGQRSLFLRRRCILFRPDNRQYQRYAQPYGHFREAMKGDRPCSSRPRDQ
jgi:hypothetical protein